MRIEEYWPTKAKNIGQTRPSLAENISLNLPFIPSHLLSTLPTGTSHAVSMAASKEQPFCWCLVAVSSVDEAGLTHRAPLLHGRRYEAAGGRMRTRRTFCLLGLRLISTRKVVSKCLIIAWMHVFICMVSIQTVEPVAAKAAHRVWISFHFFSLLHTVFHTFTGLMNCCERTSICLSGVRLPTWETAVNKNDTLKIHCFSPHKHIHWKKKLSSHFSVVFFPS